MSTQKKTAKPTAKAGDVVTVHSYGRKAGQHKIETRTLAADPLPYGWAWVATTVEDGPDDAMLFNGEEWTW